ncbi:MAG TPA: hypothetical protein V6C76_12800 [Drouetiella sp.]
MLFKNNDSPLSAVDAGKALYIGSDVVAPVIKKFKEHGLLLETTSGANLGVHSYQYAPVSESAKNTVNELERLYNQHRVAIINFIFSRGG